MTLLKGTVGALRLGPTNALTNVGFVGTVTITTTRETVVRGGYIGNDTRYRVQGAKESTVTLQGDIPATNDAGQAQLIAKMEAGEALRFEVEIGDGLTSGYVYTANALGIEEIAIEGNAQEGWTISMNGFDMDGYTLAPAS